MYSTFEIRAIFQSVSFSFVDHERLGLGMNSIAAAHKIMSPYSIQPINCIAHRHHIVSPIAEVDYYFAWNKGKHLRTSEAVNLYNLE